MATETLANLRTRIRERSDHAEPDDFVSDAELTRMINESYREFYDLVLESHADHYLAAPASFSLSSGANTYALSSLTSFYRLRGIDRRDGSGWYTVPRYQHAQRNDLRQLSYRVMGSSLFFEPIEDAAGDYRAWFIPEPATLSNDSDTVDGFNGWEVWIVEDVCAKIAAKAEESTSPFTGARDRVTERIRRAAADRDEGSPEKISDVYAQTGDWIDELY